MGNVSPGQYYPLPPGGAGHAPPAAMPSSGYAVNGPVDLIIPKPMPGVPPSAMPPVMIRPSLPDIPSVSPLPAPSYQAGGHHYAQSIPISNASPPIPPVPEVPPPQVTAPWVFQPAKTQPAGGWNGVMQPGANFQNNYYNNMQGGQTPYPYPPYGYPPQQPYPQQQQPYPPQPQNQPPQQGPEQPQKPPEEQADPASPKPPEKSTEPGEDWNAATMSETFVRSLNQQLNDPNANVRSSGAMDFYKFLETNPAVFDNPQYRPYVDAFVHKILSDPSALVRHPILLAFEMGYVRSVNKATEDLLKKLATQNRSSWDPEGDIIQSILPTLNVEQPLPATPAHPHAVAFRGNHPAQGQQLDVVSHAEPHPSLQPRATGAGQRLNLLSPAG